MTDFITPEVLKLLDHLCEIKYGGNQTKFAVHLGINQSTLSRILKGLTKNPDQATREAISKIIGTASNNLRVSSQPSPFPSDLHPILTAVVEVLKSNDKGTALALTQNIQTCHEKITKEKELIGRIELLEKIVGSQTDLHAHDPPSKAKGKSQ